MTGFVIPFNGLARQYTELKEAFDIVTNDVMSSGQYMDGKYTQLFTEWLEKINNISYAVTCHSGTQALEIIASWYKKYYLDLIDEIKPVALIPTMTFPATANAFINAGWQIRFIDCNSNGQVTQQILENYKEFFDVLVSVGLYGEPVDPDLHDGYSTIEDAAQHWTSNGFMRESSYTAISFDPTKNLPGTGNGGAILTHIKELADFARAYTTHGKFDGDHVGVGTNSRMSELDHAHLYVRSQHLYKWEARRHDIARYYIDQLHGYNGIRVLANNVADHAFQKFVLAVDNKSKRNHIKFKLAEDGVETRVHYNRPLHEYPHFEQYSNPGILSTASALSRTILSLPIYPELTDSEVEFIASRVRHHAS